MKNCPQFIETMFACWKAGLVVVPVNARLSPAEVAFHVTDCAASALVYGADFSFGAAQVPIAHKINVGGECDLSYEDLAGRAGADEQTMELHEDAPGRLFYTSGTTGRPKGAVITHRNLVFVVVSWCADPVLPAGRRRRIALRPAQPRCRLSCPHSGRTRRAEPCA